jgi:hypothetical protein
MAEIQVNAPSRNKTGEYVEGNGRRKFLVTFIKTDANTIMPDYAEGVNRSASLWIPLKSTMVVNEKTKETVEVNPAQQLCDILDELKKQNSPKRVRVSGVIRSLQMSEPVKGKEDIVYQDLTITLDDSQPKSVTLVAPAPWNFTGIDLA